METEWHSLGGFFAGQDPGRSTCREAELAGSLLELGQAALECCTAVQPQLAVAGVDGGRQARPLASSRGKPQFWFKIRIALSGTDSGPVIPAHFSDWWMDVCISLFWVAKERTLGALLAMHSSSLVSPYCDGSGLRLPSSKPEMSFANH